MENKPILVNDSENLKNEPSWSQPLPQVMKRLPSLKPPRDLALLAYQNVKNPNAPKRNKVYVPNLHLQRNKHSENTTSKVKPEPAKKKPPEKTEKVKQRPSKKLIQLDQGVFAEGVPGLRNMDQGRQSFGGRSSGNKSSHVLRKPVLNRKPITKEDKQDEENTMKELLRDDFLDDPSLEADYENAPYRLAPGYPRLTKKGAEIKSDTMKKEIKTVQEAFENASTSDSLFLSFQLPDSFPALKLGEDSRENPGTSSRENSEPSTSSEKSALGEKDKPFNEKCALFSLPGGQIGKLQILKSGRARLVFRDIKMWVDLGITQTCKQDVVSIELEEEKVSGTIYELGSVSTRMVVIPDLESLLAVPEPLPVIS